MKIKICGMREPQNIADIIALGIDYIGFIFYEKSPRYILQSNFAQSPISILDVGKTQKVGVFVNHSVDFILEKTKTFGLGLVQLHGHESVDFCDALRQEINKTISPTIDVKIIKVFSIGEDFGFAALNDYKPFVSYFLFDTKGKNLGGNGVAFDWEILKNYDNEIPFFLSGGIDIQHAKEINNLKHLNIHALDINSKFEVSAGVKDVEKIKRFAELIDR